MSGDAAERLHPAVVHHLVNTLGWRSLRPLQERAVEPLLVGAHVLLTAPTAGGKTEAAMLPLLSRVEAARWGGTTILYVCPLRALLNDLHPRIDRLCRLLGRRAGLWHGDVGQSERRRLLREPPDVLLTTPESIEAMSLSRRVDAAGLFASVRAVVVDEVHAFAGDDRGWHLIALLNRLAATAARDVQRVGLTATVGNPDALLTWLCIGAHGDRRVVTAGAAEADAPELGVDFVGSVDNAARVIAGLHIGQKRLVFADSRARVEDTAVALRREGVRTYVSHSSLGADERRQAERAFAAGSDCVIVATSTLELGIDVGDLDRVIQIGAPTTVASVLQRAGRTGRRPGTARNLLFLATRDDELLCSLALAELIRAGWVEPLEPAPFPVNLAAQQLLARTLSAGRVGRSAWPGSFSAVAASAGLDAATLDAVVRHMLERIILVELDGALHVGPEGERLYGRRHFMDVTSLFLSEPLLTARWGGRVVGRLDPSALLVREGQRPVVLLGGGAWGVGDVDWQRRIVWVEPTEDRGRSRWSGSAGALSLPVAHAIRRVLAAGIDQQGMSRRARTRLGELREELWFVEDGCTVVDRDSQRDRARWWTFAGGRANAELAARLHGAGRKVFAWDDLAISIGEAGAAAELRSAAADVRPARQADERRLHGVKFHEAVPEALVQRLVARRDADPDGVERCLAEPLSVAAR